MEKILNNCKEITIELNDGTKMVCDGNMISSVSILEKSSIPMEEAYLDLAWKRKAIKEIRYELDINFNDKMTRKRFIKLLMSIGIQRNTANELARYSLKKFGYYSSVYLINLMGG